MKEILFALRRWAAYLALPWFRHELPGWPRLSSWVGLPIRHQAQWASRPPRTITGKTHGLRMVLHMQDWSERLTYFLGRYYELPVELLIRALARRGETYIDVGGNIGMETLTGAACVGPQGRIHTFEPNPRMAARIREMVALNGLTNVTVHSVGLSDEAADLTLTVVDEANGWSTFARLVEKDATLTYREVSAKVVRADDALPKDIAGPVTVKIDVEGFECHALRGMAGLVGRCFPAIITEVDERLLRMAGSSAAELFGILQGWGYVGFEAIAEGGGRRGRLRLRRIEAPGTAGMNAAWIHPRSVFADRVKPHVEG